MTSGPNRDQGRAPARPAAAPSHPAPAPPLLTIGGAAERVNVAASTLRTWEQRYGFAPSGRTGGGHRRYTVADVAALQALRRLVRSGMSPASAATHAGRGARPTARATASAAGTHEPATQFRDSVEHLNFAGAAEAASILLEEQGVVAAWTDVFVPHLQAAGQRWASSHRGVEREHLATAAIHAALTGYTRERAQYSADRTMLAAATPTERHTLPLDALVAAAAEQGVQGCMLGTLPAVALQAAVSTLRPSVIVLWARTGRTTSPALLASLVGHVPVVCSAGPGWLDGSISKPVTHVSDLAGAVHTVTAWTS